MGKTQSLAKTVQNGSGHSVEMVSVVGAQSRRFLRGLGACEWGEWDEVRLFSSYPSHLRFECGVG